MSVSFPSGVFSPMSASTSAATGPQKSASLSAKPANSAVQQFLEFANMSPAERMQAEMLGQLGLTEDQFKAMSPADQQKVEDKIRDMIKQQAQTSGEKRTGLITDISA